MCPVVREDNGIFYVINKIQNKMKKKSKNFQSLKSILWLLQNIQMNEFERIPIHLDTHEDSLGDSFITVDVWGKDYKIESFSFYSFSSSEKREKTYNDLLQFIKDK
jgi:hypothetical protein